VTNCYQQPNINQQNSTSISVYVQINVEEQTELRSASARFFLPCSAYHIPISRPFNPGGCLPRPDPLPPETTSLWLASYQ